MTINQVYEFVNTATQEAIGETAIVSEDLGNIVDIGNAVFNANAVDAYVRGLVNHIGKVVFANVRDYRGAVPSIMRDSWEYGSYLEKISIEIPSAIITDDWNLNDGETFDPNVFYKPTTKVKFYNDRVTFTIPFSITERQIKQSFSNATQMNAFISALYNAVEKSMTIKMSELSMRTINEMIGETAYDDFGASEFSSMSGVKAVNLWYLFTEAFPGTTTTVDNCLTDPDFIRFAAYTIGNIASA